MGHDPPRTHEKITGKTDSFRALFIVADTTVHLFFPVRPERGEDEHI